MGNRTHNLHPKRDASIYTGGQIKDLFYFIIDLSIKMDSNIEENKKKYIQKVKINEKKEIN